MDNHGLFLRCGNSQILVPQPFTRSKIISARKLTNKPHDSIFFRSKNNTPTSTSSALISSSLPNCFSTTFTVGHPQRISARRLIFSSTTSTLVLHGRISSSLSSSSSNNDHDHKSKISKVSSSSRAGASASLAFNCVLWILCCGSMMALMLPNKATAVKYFDSYWPRPGHKAAPVPGPDQDGISPLSGISVMDGFLHSVLFLTSPKDVTMSDVPMFYNEDVLKDKVPKQAFNLIKSGKTGEALQLLESKLVNAGPELKYYYEMALVEVLISLGRFDEALKMGCLWDVNTIRSDIRRDLYKAIIYTMMKDKKEKAEDHWRGFLKQGFKAGRFPTL